ncbi:hypothetical protein [Pseudomonas sp. RIT-PI-AD]|uniref:hypothetical protein n=1 Tax=Pseudomonas sp. RIT-PI-AD TaxID=3035294 RepID=UPI0021D9256F|nr:hypothetical protein [Pseudomonas sp. RIT-PI-AD]
MINALRMDVQPILPLLRRHVEDAAFYWEQRDRSLQSPHVDLARLQHFDRLLQAHLDGVAVAADQGWDEAWRALERWGGAGEAFVCASIGLLHPDGTRLQALWPVIEGHPQRLARGLVSALAWYASRPGTLPTPWIEHWMAQDKVPLLKAIALRAAACCGWPRQAIALEACRAETAALRLAGYRALALPGGSPADIEVLRNGLAEADPRMRGEAACSLSLRGQELHRALPVLLEAVGDAVRQLGEAQGVDKRPLERRARRWLLQAALHLPPGHPQVPGLVQGLPRLLTLDFIAWHGDCAYVPLLLEAMDDPAMAQGALWALQTLTGVPSEWVAGVRTPHEVLSGAFAGLPYPDVAQARSWWANSQGHFPPGQRRVAGQAVDGSEPPAAPDWRIRWLREGCQRQRHLAAAHWRRAHPDTFINLRQPARQQWAALEQSFDA